MIKPHSSPFHAQLGDDLTPQELLEYLNSILVEVLAPGTIIKGDGRREMVTLLRDLCCITMGQLPQAGATEWSMLKDRVNVIDVSLDLINRALLCVEGIVGGDDGLERIMLSQFLIFGGTLETWIASGRHDARDQGSPQQLKTKLHLVALKMLAVLAGMDHDVQHEKRPRPCLGALRTCLEECLGIATDLLSTTFLGPLYLTFFGNPRLGESRQECLVETNRETVIRSAIVFDTLITDSLYLLTHSICSLATQTVVSEISKQATEIACSYLADLLNPTKHISVTRQKAGLARLLRAIEPVFSLQIFEAYILPPYLCRLLMKRLDDGPHASWDDVDENLGRVLVAMPSGTRLGVEDTCFQEILENRTWEDEKECKLRDMIYTCLRVSVPLLKHTRLQQLEAALSSRPRCPKLNDLLQMIHQRTSPVEPSVSSSLGKRKRDLSSWRLDVTRAIGKWFSPNDAAWMDDCDGLGDIQWCGQVVERVSQKLSRFPDSANSDSRILVSKQLEQIPCLLSHAETTSCSRAIITPGLTFIPAFTTIALRLLSGPEKEVTSQVHRYAYQVLWQAARHHSQGLGGSKLEHIFDLVKQGMQKHERDIRIIAGRVLAEVVICQSSSRGSLYRLQPIIQGLTELLRGRSLGVTETTLITIGVIGRAAQDDLLGKVLQLLVSQLGHQNPVIKGLAYIQLLEIAKHRDQSSYGLFAPYLPLISVAVVTAVAANPDLLLQMCSFLDMSASKFYNLTIAHFLPHLVCTCNGDALKIVAKELRKSPVSLITTHDILANVFLLDVPGQTEGVFKFILDLLVQSKNDASEEVTVLMLVKSTVVPLLGEIIICMGDTDPKRVNQAMSAIRKVEDVLASERRHRTSNMLADYVMGIVSHLNEVLQDVHGKKPLAVKKKVMRGLGALIRQVGAQIVTVAPQIMATMQSMLPIHPLADDTLSSWHIFITTLAFKDIGPYVGPTSAAFVAAWSNLRPYGRDLVMQAFKYLILDNAEAIGANLDEIVRLDSIPDLVPYSVTLDALRASWTPTKRLENLLDRVTSDNLTVAELSLLELRQFMAENHQHILKLASGDVFDPIISKLIASLWDTACRDGEGADELQVLAFDCIGRLGAVDPDRLELVASDTSMILYENFNDEDESIQFALYLITDVLLGTYRSTTDIKFQSHLAFAIQELLKFCEFTDQLVSAHSTNAIPLKIRSRWSRLPRHVLEVCTPLLQAKYTPTSKTPRDVPHPIYPTKSTYREWMQDWTAHLIDRVSMGRPRAIFDVFLPVVVDRDVGVARHLLPHLVLHVLISGHDMDAQNLQMEIAAVLIDQVQPAADSSSDRRLLCAQTIFMLMDHLNKWIRAVRQDLVNRRADNKRSRVSDALQESENNLAKVDSVLSSVNHELMAKAAFECKAYARSLMNFERQILICEEKGTSRDDVELQTYYERLHEIYSHLDEPDGMEGVTTKVLAPSLEHQIRQHESTGRWTSAQSCWEVRLQKSPDNLDFHLGLLRCLRNLGHYDTLRTHIKGVLSRNPDWYNALSGFQAEGAWMVGDWLCVQELAQRTTLNPLPEIILARVLLAIREGNPKEVANTLSVARAQLGAPIYAAGRNAYRRIYESVLNLHLVRDVELIYEATVAGRSGDENNINLNTISTLSEVLSRRFEATLPSFRTREPVLSLQRTALGLSDRYANEFRVVIGRAWLSTAKIARKAGHAQTAYSALLQAQRAGTPFSFIQSSKLVKASGEPIRALQELNKALEKSSMIAHINANHTTEEVGSEVAKMNAKAQVLRAQWMYEAERFDIDLIHRGFKQAVGLAQNWESAHFHLGKFYDQRFARMTRVEKDSYRGRDLNYQTIKCYAKTLQIGSKYVYQTMPRMLTLWLDLGEKEGVLQTEKGLDLGQILDKVNSKISAAMRSVATYKWLTAFPQIISRIDHSNKPVYDLLSNLIIHVLQEYPHQGLWLFMSVVQSKRPERNLRGEMILNKLMGDSHNAGKSVSTIANDCRMMTNELLKLCNYIVPDDLKANLSMAKLFPGLAKLAPSQLIVPLQESLIASLPSESSLEASHQPFPRHLPTIHKFDDAIEVMKSLAKPRKITLRADNGKTFAFLGKPKDDLRKDARLMDFNAMINKLLKTNSDSRRRQLHIRTYSVITLNEESGFIQWVPHTIPMRPVLIRSYEVRNIASWSSTINQIFAKIKDLPVDQATDLFVRDILPNYPPVFHEWFIDTFSEPSAWLTSRLSYARTAAVMSMVGYIIGLGDRHSENILLDINTGDIIHVDFDCLFDRGKKLETPERVPFRLTQNIQDGLGVTNVDGPFRIACEITMSLLRRNKDCLMSVLDAFIHDPLVEWEDEKKKMDKQRKTAAAKKRGPSNALKNEVDLRKLAQNALLPIQRKLQGIYTSGEGREEWKDGKEMTTSNLVDTLIQEAKSNKNLAKMYPGWGPFL